MRGRGADNHSIQKMDSSLPVERSSSSRNRGTHTCVCVCVCVIVCVLLTLLLPLSVVAIWPVATISGSVGCCARHKTSSSWSRKYFCDRVSGSMVTTTAAAWSDGGSGEEGGGRGAQDGKDRTDGRMMRKWATTQTPSAAIMVNKQTSEKSQSMFEFSIPALICE